MKTSTAPYPAVANMKKELESQVKANLIETTAARIVACRSPAHGSTIFIIFLIGQIINLEISGQLFINLITKVEIPNIIAAIAIVIIFIETTANSAQQISLPSTAIVVQTYFIAIWLNRALLLRINMFPI